MFHRISNAAVHPCFISEAGIRISEKLKDFNVEENLPKLYSGTIVLRVLDSQDS